VREMKMSVRSLTMPMPLENQYEKRVWNAQTAVVSQPLNGAQ
jgi:hypothetical protein